MKAPDARVTSRGSIVAFYVVALALSWGLWGPWVASARTSGSDASWWYLHLLGSLGPCAAALLVTAWTRGGARLRELVRRTATAQAGRVALIWGLLFPAAAFVVSAGIMGFVNHTS